MRLADALVDQGCYQEAVEILEGAQEGFPRNAELAGKLRDTRSLVTEQTYIEGLTQAAESAKIARNQLRCTKLADISACDDALHSKPDDVPLLLAKGDALMQANRPAEAVTVYRHVSQLKPGDDSLETKLASAEALVAKNPPPGAPSGDAAGAGAVVATGAGAIGAGSAGAGSASARSIGAASVGRGSIGARSTGAPAVAANGATRAKAPWTTTAAEATVAANRAGAKSTSGLQPNGGQHLTATPAAAIAALAPESKTYSNDAPPGQTN
jgi:tetratricopeptide (TPR) repeat protein